MEHKIKFYTDEHVSKAVIRGLRQRGIDVLTIVEADMLSASDEEHLELARKQERVIFTQDKHFLKLHARGIYTSQVIYSNRERKFIR